MVVNILTRGNIRQVLQDNNKSFEPYKHYSEEELDHLPKIITDEQLIHVEDMIYKASHEDETVEYKIGNNILRLTWSIERKQFLSYYHVTENITYEKTCKQLTFYLGGSVNSISTPKNHLYYNGYNEKTRNKLLNDVQFTKEFVIKHPEILINQCCGTNLSTYKKINETYEWHTTGYQSFDPYFEGEMNVSSSMDHLCRRMIIQYSWVFE